MAMNSGAQKPKNWGVCRAIFSGVINVLLKFCCLDSYNEKILEFHDHRSRFKSVLWYFHLMKSTRKDLAFLRLNLLNFFNKSTRY